MHARTPGMAAAAQFQAWQASRHGSESIAPGDEPFLAAAAAAASALTLSARSPASAVSMSFVSCVGGVAQ